MWSWAILLVLAARAGGDLAQGREIYLKNCARCHGPEGRGDTELKLTPPPRNFREGRFSFGNTQDALFNTVSTGIPGTAMLAFDETLGEADRRAVVAYVHSLIPDTGAASQKDTALLVGKTPKIVRGYLPARSDDELPLARGLAIGMPGGFTLVYRTDDVRLIGVRHGAFVERTDWLGRGGTPLALLGDPFPALPGGDPPPPFALSAGQELLPLAASFAGTWTSGASAGLAYELHGPAQRGRIAHVEESAAVERVTGALGFTRRWVISGTSERRELGIDLVPLDGTGRWLRGAPERWTRSGSRELSPLPRRHWLVRSGPHGCEYLLLVTPDGSALVRSDEAVTALVPVASAGAEVRASTMLADAWSDELFERLDEEVGR